MKKFLAPTLAVSLCLLSASALAKDAALNGPLKDRVGKKVSVVLKSGTELTGKVANVGNDTVTLSELSGKEYFDAVIDLDDISAVEYRARDN